MHRMLAAIRESNPTRTVYVTSNRWSSFRTVADVELPQDAHIAFTVHFYEPFVFTHQRAPWAGFANTLPAVTFPGRVPDVTGHTLPHYSLNLHAGDPLTVAQVEDAFTRVADWAKVHAPGVEIYLGEFGVYQAADAASQRRWISTVVHACETHGWGWAVWDYNDSFGVRRPDGRSTAILEGLFQKSP